MSLKENEIDNFISVLQRQMTNTETMCRIDIDKARSEGELLLKQYFSH